MFVCRCRCGALNIKNPQLQVTDCWTFHIITLVTRIHVISSVYIFWWTITIVTSKQWSLDFRGSIYRNNYTPIHLLHLSFVKKKTKCIYSLFLLCNLKKDWSDEIMYLAIILHTYICEYFELLCPFHSRNSTSDIIISNWQMRFRAEQHCRGKNNFRNVTWSFGSKGLKILPVSLVVKKDLLI